MVSAGLEMEEKVYLKLWVKPGYAPQSAQIVPKWHLASQLARTHFFQHARATRHAKKFLFSPGVNLCGFGLEMEEKVHLELWV